MKTKIEAKQMCSKEYNDFHNAYISGLNKGRQEILAEVEKMIDEPEFLELLSELEHNQWVYWTQNIVNFEEISEDTQDKWAGLWRSYDNLKEEDKKKDRKFAKLVLEELKQKLQEIKNEPQSRKT